MDKETLSHYGWIVILVLILAVMLALASPLGSFVAGAIKSTTTGLFDVNQNALGSVGINVDDLVFENCDHLNKEVINTNDRYTGDTVCKDCGEEISKGETKPAIVPEGGKYTAADGTVYNPGDEMPETVTTGDKYRYGHYEYAYNQYTNGSLSWTTNETQNGWGVDAIQQTKQTYDEILKTINGMPITNMDRTFKDCRSMITAPEIPSTVTSMQYTFVECVQLLTPPEIPNSVTNMNATFRVCSSMTIAPIIPNGVTSMDDTFGHCYAMKTYVGSTDPDGDFSKFIIPSGVVNLYATFNNCDSFIVPPTIPNTVITMRKTFCYCDGLTDLSNFVIPNSVTSLEDTFEYCKSLTTPPSIRNATNLTDMSGTFRECTALIDLSDFIIPNSVTDMRWTFIRCSSLEIAPTIPDSVTTMQSTFQDCTSLTTVAVVPYKVTNLGWLFKNCTSLTGTITINISSCGETGCFESVDFEAQNLTLAGSSAKLDTLGRTGTNYCTICNGKCQGGH